MAILLYSTINLILVLLGKNCFKKWFNPITIYSIVWEISLLFHQSGFIYYYDMTWYTWFVIYFCQIIFTFACCIEHSFGFYQKNATQPFYYQRDDVLKKTLRKYIFITLVVSGTAILINLSFIIETYGTDLLLVVTDVYDDRVNEGIDLQKVPYLGQFIFVTLPMLGIYVKKYGFSILLLPAILLVCLNSFTSGGRAGIVFSLLLIIFGYLLTEKPVHVKKNRCNLNYIWLLICLGALVAMIVQLSEIRSVSSTNEYATQSYKNLFGDNPTIFKTVSYISNPIATLNEYLKTEDFYFGKNTFLPIYNILAKFGFIDRFEQYQEWYYTPMGCNVGTWLRELIQDFTLIGCVVSVFVFGIVTTKAYMNSQKNCDIKNKIIGSVLFMIVTLSFFDWKLRGSNMWIALFCGYYIGKKIEKKCCLKYDRRFNA